MKKLLRLFGFLILFIVLIIVIRFAMNYDYWSCMLNASSIEDCKIA